MTARTVRAIEEVLAGRRRSPWSAFLFAGPAIVASVAYLDPGNFATNIQAGARYGYDLLWVVVVANLIAMLFQALSAKLGIATGRNLAELCRAHFPPGVAFGMWALSEVAAMATDLAEFLGGAVGISILLHLPLLIGMAATAIVTYLLLILDRKGFRPLELAIGGLVAAICLCYLVEIFIAPVAWGSVAFHAVVPSLPSRDAIAIAVGIIGATVMPHALFLHSGLTQARARVRNADERRTLVRFSNREVMIALFVAGLVNMGMVIMASSAFHSGHRNVDQIETAYHTLGPLLGPAAAGVFLGSLIASGISSSVVGTMAGQIIMQGFIGFRVPLWVRRIVTMTPAFVVVALGANVTQALLISQVVLSLALPLPMILLVWFTRRRDVMGDFANGRLTDATAILAAAVVVILNLMLLMQFFRLPIPGVF